MIKCEICERTPEDGVTLIRQNPKGEVGVFRCIEHNEVDVDEGLREVINALNDD